MTLPKQLTIELFKLSGTSITPARILALVASVAIAIIVGRWTQRIVQRVMTGRGNEGTAYAIARIAHYVTVALIVLIGLDNFGVSLSSLAAVGAFVSVGVGFGMQNIVQNFVSGLILLVERPIKRGDFVRTGDTVGVVDEIAMRATRILTRNGIAIIVPNSELVTSRVVNLSAPTSYYRAGITVGVAYGSDLQRVKKTLLDVAQRDERVLDVHPPEVYFRDFADSALSFELCVWLADPQQEPKVTSDLRFAIDEAFRREGIEIPFPQREIRMKQVP